MERIRRYFNNVSKKLAIESDLAGDGVHRGDIGTNRENIFLEFLNKHLPSRLKANLGGEIIGLGKGTSAQLDIVVTNDIAPRFEEKEKTFFVTEGVAAVISVKSYLDKAQLNDALENLSSIPELSPDALKFNASIANDIPIFYKYYPSLYILAFDGISMDTLLKHVNDFYAVNPDIPKNRYPVKIFVNGKYDITYTKSDAIAREGNTIPADTFYPLRLTDDLIGYPFIYMLEEFNKYMSWLPFMSISMSEYYNRSFKLKNENT